MTLTDFIRTRMEDILQEWETHAKAILSPRNLSREALRDHIEDLLRALADELEQADKGDQVGGPSLTDSTPAYLAQTHGAERHDLGADIVHLTQEFRVLRLTVAKLWTRASKKLQNADQEELIRFNNEIDKALGHSIERYALKNEKQGRLFETMLSSLPDPFYIVNLDGVFLYANAAMAELCNLPACDIKGRKLTEMPLPRDYNGEARLREVANSKQLRHGEVTVHPPGGKARCLETLCTPVLNQQGEVEAIAGMAHDITERKESEAKIWHHANFDLLTDIPNRRLFRDRLNQQTAHSDRTGTPFALLFIDLDHFKEINDRLGHDSGDLLLTQAAERICSCVRHSDTVARIGGDEFTVLLLDTGDLTLINSIARKILAALERPFCLDSRQVSVSGSIGITLFPADATTPGQLLTNADRAMYQAKETGRNRISFFSDILERARSEHQRFMRELSEAAEHQQLRLYYQPIVDLASGQIVKAEALLRWQHPRKGLLLPADFLSLAEEAGLMTRLESWIFSQAASCSGQWTALAQHPVQIAINISPMQFIDNNHTRPWEPYLEAFANADTSLAVEMTEDVFLPDSGFLAERFAELKQAGIQLALDDFGTGNSSLAYLKRFHVNYLKIDPSFIRDSHSAPEGMNQTIAESMIVMAHKLGLKVVAEGVETAAQCHWLSEAGCDFAQGFFFSRPLPAKAFEHLLRAGPINTAPI